MLPESEYQMFLNQTNLLTERRQNITTTYLSVNAALVAATAFLFKDGQLLGWQVQVSVIVLLLAGVIACSLWRRLIIQYTTLIGWWYEKLRALEATLPNSSKFITKEYNELYQVTRGSVPTGMTQYEVQLTWLFTIIYSSFALAILFSFIQDVVM